MAVSRGKKFENVIRECCERVLDVNVERLPDPVQGYLGVRNKSDFIVYKYPHQYYLECKSIQGNRFPLSNLTKNQYEGMLGVSKVHGIIAGVIIWWVDKDVTKFVPIEEIEAAKKLGEKSIPYYYPGIVLHGKKKRVFFDYDMKRFLEECELRWNKANTTKSES